MQVLDNPFLATLNLIWLQLPLFVDHHNALLPPKLLSQLFVYNMERPSRFPLLVLGLFLLQHHKILQEIILPFLAINWSGPILIALWLLMILLLLIGFHL